MLTLGILGIKWRQSWNIGRIRRNSQCLDEMISTETKGKIENGQNFAESFIWKLLAVNI